MWLVGIGDIDERVEGCEERAVHQVLAKDVALEFPGRNGNLQDQFQRL